MRCIVSSTISVGSILPFLAVLTNPDKLGSIPVVGPFIAVAWTLMYFALAQGRTAATAGSAEAYAPPPPPSDGPTYP